METQIAVEAEVGEGFVPERKPVPRRIERRLEVRRAQELMKALPDWGLSWKTQAINRTRQFGSAQEAAAFASAVAGLAAGEGQMVNLFLAGANVMITLVGRPVAGGPLALSQGVLDFAHQIESN